MTSGQNVKWPVINNCVTFSQVDKLCRIFMHSRLTLRGSLLIFAIFVDLSVARAQDVTDLKSKAESGDVVAQSSLANAYHLGKGVPKDEAEAARWWQKAAEKGDLASQVNLGIAYQFGTGVAKNYAAAAHWYGEAAEQGNAGAQSNLAALSSRARNSKGRQ